MASKRNGNKENKIKLTTDIWKVTREKRIRNSSLECFNGIIEAEFTQKIVLDL